MKKFGQIGMLVCLAMILMVSGVQAAESANSAFPTVPFGVYLTPTAPVAQIGSFDLSQSYYELLKINISVSPSFIGRVLNVFMTDGKTIYPIGTIKEPVAGTVYTLFKDLSVPRVKYAIYAQMDPAGTTDQVFKVYGEVIYMVYVN